MHVSVLASGQARYLSDLLDSGFKFSQCEMSMCLRPLRTCLCELTKTAEVVLSILLEAFAFRLPDVEIGWNTASVHYPSVKNNAKARLPMKVKKL